MRPSRFPALALAVLVGSTAATAQAPLPPLRVGPGGGLAAGFELYRFGNAAQTGVDQISLATLPFAVRAPIYAGTSLEISGAFARGQLTRADGTSTTVSGLTDTQVALSVPLKPQVATVTAVAILPTGKSKMTPDEAVVAGVVASELLPFRISNWGAGGAAGASLALAHSFGTVGLGASAAYLVAREYDLVSPDVPAYRPGNQLRARVALDAATGSTGKASLQLTYLHSADDQFSGTNVFRAGDRFQALGSFAFAAGATANGIVYAGVLHRAQGSYLVQLGPTPVPQNLFLAGGGMRLPRGNTVLMPALDVRVLRRSDGSGEGEMAGLGGSAEVTLSPGATLIPTARARFGRVQMSSSSSSGFLGVDLALGLRFGAGAP